MELKLFELFKTDTLRHRETARIVVELLYKQEDEQKILNFDRIEFASRSFLHELLSDIGDKKVTFLNASREIKEMTKIAQKGVYPLTA